MCRSLCLPEVFRRLGFNPAQAYQFADTAASVGLPTRPSGEAVPYIPLSGCQGLLREYDWQAGNRISRSEIRTAIKEAAERIEQFVGYPPFPRMFTETVRLGPDKNGCQQFKTCVGGLVAFGTEKEEHVGIAEIDMVDEDSDGMNDNFAIEVSDLLNPPAPSEIVLRFTDADIPLGRSATDFEIGDFVARRINNKISVTGGAYGLFQLARPSRYEGFFAVLDDARGGNGDSAALNPHNTANFVDALAVKRRWIDTTAGVIEVGNDICKTCGCDRAHEQCNCAANNQTPKVSVVNARLGIGAIETCGYDWARVSYRAGGCICDTAAQTTTVGECVDEVYRSADCGCGNCGCNLTEAVIALAVSLMRSPCCACADTSSESQLHRWQVDRALRTQDKAYLGATVRNYFGSTREGAWVAHEKAEPCRINRSGKLF